MVGGLILHFFKQCTVGVGFLKVSALVLDGVSAFPRSCLLYCLPVCLSSCFPVAGGLILHFFPNSVRLGVLTAFSCHVFDPVPQHVLNPPTVWGLRWCNFVLFQLVLGMFLQEGHEISLYTEGTDGGIKTFLGIFH